MTEDQINKGYLLEIAHATRKVPRTIEYFAGQMTQIRGRVDTRALMDVMLDDGLVECHKDGLDVRRYQITGKGVAAWDAL